MKLHKLLLPVQTIWDMFVLCVECLKVAAFLAAWCLAYPVREYCSKRKWTHPETCGSLPPDPDPDPDGNGNAYELRYAQGKPLTNEGVTP